MVILVGGFSPPIFGVTSLCAPEVGFKNFSIGCEKDKTDTVQE